MKYSIGQVVHFITDDTYGSPYKGLAVVTDYQSEDGGYPYRVKTAARGYYGANDKHLRELTKLEKVIHETPSS